MSDPTNPAAADETPAPPAQEATEGVHVSEIKEWPTGSAAPPSDWPVPPGPKSEAPAIPPTPEAMESAVLQAGMHPPARVVLEKADPVVGRVPTAAQAAAEAAGDTNLDETFPGGPPPALPVPFIPGWSSRSDIPNEFIIVHDGIPVGGKSLSPTEAHTVLSWLRSLPVQQTPDTAG